MGVAAKNSLSAHYADFATGNEGRSAAVDDIASTEAKNALNTGLVADSAARLETMGERTGVPSLEASTRGGRSLIQSGGAIAATLIADVAGETEETDWASGSFNTTRASKAAWKKARGIVGKTPNERSVTDAGALAKGTESGADSVARKTPTTSAKAQKAAQLKAQVAAQQSARQAAYTAAAKSGSVVSGTAAGGGSAAAASGAASGAAASAAGGSTLGGGASAGAAAGGGGLLPIAGGLLIILLVVALVLGGVVIISAVLGSAEDTYAELNETENAVALFLKEKGLDNVQIAAIMGNISAESGFDTGSLEKGTANSEDGGHGLLQWTGGRWTSLKNLAAEMGRDWSDIEVQLELLWREIEGSWSGNYVVNVGSTDPPYPTRVSGTKAGFFGTDDVATATSELCYGFIRPGIPWITKRIGLADYYFEVLSRSHGSSAQKVVATEARSHASVAHSHASLGYCLGWVNCVYVSAGYPLSTAYVNCASESRWRYMVSTDTTNIPLGAAVFSGNGYNSGVTCGGHDAGHVGIYIGDGLIQDQVGQYSVERWMAYHNACGTGGWGWLGGVDLTKA